MPLWAGPLALPAPSQPLQGLCLSAPPSLHASSTLLPKRARLSMLAFIDPSKVPLWMAAGPSLDVYTTEEGTEEWFRRVFCGDEGVGMGVEEGGELDEVRQCQVGVLVEVGTGDAAGEETDGEGLGGGGGGADWAVTELLVYGRVERKEVEMGVTPPRSSPTERGMGGEGVGGEEGEREREEEVVVVVEGETGQMTKVTKAATTIATTTTTTVITRITLHALPLTSHHNFLSPLSALQPPSSPLEPSTSTLAIPGQQKQAPLTPINTSKLNHLLTQKASFLLPNPLDSPQISKSVKKRRADVLSQAVENRKRNRFTPVVPPPPPAPPQQGRREGGLSRKQSMISLGGYSREHSLAFMREGTSFSVRDREREKERERGEWDDDHYHRPRSPSPEKSNNPLRSRPGTSSTGISRPGTSMSGMNPVIKKEPSFSSYTWPKLPPPAPGASRPTSGVSGGPVKRSSTAGLNTTFPVAGGATAASPTDTSAASPTDIQLLDSTIEAKNKDSLSRMVLSGMKLYGLKRPTPNSMATSTSEGEEYKFVYHNTFKSAVFALRFRIGVEIIEGGVLGGVVERLLGVFCGEIGGGGLGLDGGRVSPVAAALVEIEGLKGRVKELEREVVRVKREEEGEEVMNVVGRAEEKEKGGEKGRGKVVQRGERRARVG